MNALAIGVAAIIAGLALTAEGGKASSSTTGLPALAPPEPPPLLLRDVSPQDAVSINHRIPFTLDGNFPAQPFRFRGDAEARARALECLTMAVYYEAGSQDQAGQEAVAQVILNRVRHPAFPASVCGVVFQGYERPTGCQFTFTCDGALTRAPSKDLWARAQQVAAAALDGAVFKPVGLATHYHADYVVPYWATSLSKNAQVGVHIFYRWPRAWGMPAAFQRRYSGSELDPASLMAAAVMGHGRWLALTSPDGEKLVQAAPDPRVELLGVVQLLATGAASDGDGKYTKDINTYFAAEKDHQAVALFRKLSAANKGFAAAATNLILTYSSPPDLKPAKQPPADLLSAAGSADDVSSFVDALRDFAGRSEFMRFFAGHKPYYSSIVRSSRMAGVASAQWQAYTGIALDNRRLIVSSVLGSGADDGCGASDGSSVRSLAALTSSSKAEAFLSARPAAGLFEAKLPKSKGLKEPSPTVQEQIVRAVFSRIATLTAGDVAGREALQHELKLGNKLVPVFDTRLRYFEAHRGEFRTLADFLPQLLKDLPKADASAKAAQCAPTTVASAEIVPQTSNGGL